MHGLRIALGACLLFMAPALVAQAATPRPNVRTIPPFKRAIPGTPPRFPVHPSHPIQPIRPIRPFNVSYPVYVDGYFGNQYLDRNHYVDPPLHREQSNPSKSGEDVFETHSSNDALFAR